MLRRCSQVNNFSPLTLNSLNLSPILKASRTKDNKNGAHAFISRHLMHAYPIAKRSPPLILPKRVPSTSFFGLYIRHQRLAKHKACMPVLLILLFCLFSSSKIFSLHARLLGGLALNLKLEVKVGRVEVVHTHVTVLTTGAVALASGVDCDVVERTEVTAHTADLLLENLVVEARFEFTLARRSGCDVHSSLSTSENNKLLGFRCDRGRVERCVGNVGLEDFHRVCVV